MTLFELFRSQIHLLSRRWVRSERAATLVEYAMIIFLIASVCIISVGFFGQKTGSKFSDISTRL